MQQPHEEDGCSSSDEEDDEEFFDSRKLFNVGLAPSFGLYTDPCMGDSEISTLLAVVLIRWTSDGDAGALLVGNMMGC